MAYPTTPSFDTRKAHADRAMLACQDCGLHDICFPRQLVESDRFADPNNLRRQRLVRAGFFLFHAGQRYRGLSVLRSGTVRLHLHDRNGGERTTHFALPGEVIDLAGFSGGQHTQTAEALEDCHICEVPAGVLSQFTKNHPERLETIIGLLCETTQSQQCLALSIGTGSALQRVASFLKNISERRQQRRLDGEQFSLSMTRHLIANYLGLTLETVSRSFSQLQRDGVIQCRAKRIEIRSREALEALCDSALVTAQPWPGQNGRCQHD